MGRPGLALGTAGKIRCTPRRPGIAPSPGTGTTTAGAARSNDTPGPRLPRRQRCGWPFGTVPGSTSAGTITRDTPVNVLAEAWYASLKNLSPTTLQAYRNRLDQQVLPGLGNLRVRELSVGTIDRHLRLIADKHGPAVAKMTKSVLSGLCGLAARHDALERNPVRDTGRIETSTKKAPKALTAEESRTLLTRLDADERCSRRR